VHPPKSTTEDLPRGGEVEILLATHNSAAYLEDLLASLFQQSWSTFTLLIGDDASADGTTSIIHRYSRAYPGRVRLLTNPGHAMGPLKNFARLLGATRARYIFLCDHDDVWRPTKLELCLREMARAEAVCGPDTPILIHTDLAVVDADLRTIHPSAWAYANIDPRHNTVPELLLSNIATGCAMLINAALCRKAQPVPADAMMHDHWLALIAAAVGVVRHIPTSTVLYRQHGHNVIGLQPWRPRSILSRIYQTVVGGRKLDIFDRQCRQAAALCRHPSLQISARDRAAAAALARLWELPRWKRVAALRAHGLSYGGALRKIALYYLVTTAKAKPSMSGRTFTKAKDSDQGCPGHT
jgi:glycosyltransferase involved in cell wall biosynthesis